MKKNGNLFWKLFTATFCLSAFTFGGGYVIISLMKAKFVDELHWIQEDEMLNLAAIAQSSPGAVAVNAAILLGYRVKGIVGALAAIIGTVLPPLIIISVITLFYAAFRDNVIVNAVLKGMQAGVAAVIAGVVISLGGTFIKDREYGSVIIMLCAFAATFFGKVNVIYIILACGVTGMLRTWVILRKGGSK